MSAQPENDTAFSSYLDKWLVAAPEVRLVRVFVGAAREPRYEAFACLEHELLDAACATREREPALAKLGWWRDELERACAGVPRHPISRRLHELRALDPSRLAAANALVVAASRIAALASPGDCAALLAPFDAFAAAFRSLRTGDSGSGEPACALGAALLASELRHWSRFAAPERARVPLSLLARAGISRAELVQGHAGATTVLDGLAAELSPLLATTNVDVIAGARATVAVHIVRALRRNPRASVARAPVVRSLPLLFALWRVAHRAAANARAQDRV